MKEFSTICTSLGIGDRVIIPKSSLQIVQHHAIYIGILDGRHCFIENKEGLGVRLITEELFFSGVTIPVKIIPFTPSWNYSRQELLRFAFSKLGQPYHLTKYNCEHFATEIQQGVPKSAQVDTAKGLAGVALTLLVVHGAIRLFR